MGVKSFACGWGFWVMRSLPIHLVLDCGSGVESAAVADAKLESNASGVQGSVPSGKQGLAQNWKSHFMSYFAL